MGYPSQREAVEALHESLMPSSEIAQVTGLPINSVTRIVLNYRVRTGNVLATQKRPNGRTLAPAPDRVTDYAYFNWKKAKAGAKQALHAIKFGV